MGVDIAIAFVGRESDLDGCVGAKEDPPEMAEAKTMVASVNIMFVIL